MTLLVAIALAVVASGSAEPPAHGSMSITGAGKFRHESQGVVAPGDDGSNGNDGGGGEQRASMMRKERVMQPAALDDASADGIAPQVAINLYNAINNGADAFQSVATTINQQAQEIQALNKANSVMTGASTPSTLLEIQQAVDNFDPCFGGTHDDCTNRGMQNDNRRCTWNERSGHAGACEGIVCTQLTGGMEECQTNSMCRWDSSVSKCYQRHCSVLTTSSDPNWCDSSPSCHTKGGDNDVCVQKQCEGMHEELCWSSEKDCLWHVGGQHAGTCTAIRCNGLSSHLAGGGGGGGSSPCADMTGCTVHGEQCVGCSALLTHPTCQDTNGCEWDGTQCNEHCSIYTSTDLCLSPLHPSCGWNEVSATPHCEVACSNSGEQANQCATADTDDCTDSSGPNAWMSSTCFRECRTCPVACHLISESHCGNHPSCLWHGGHCKKVCANFLESVECGANDHCRWNTDLVPASCVDKSEAEEDEE